MVAHPPDGDSAEPSQLPVVSQRSAAPGKQSDVKGCVSVAFLALLGNGLLFGLLYLLPSGWILWVIIGLALLCSPAWLLLSAALGEMGFSSARGFWRKAAILIGALGMTALALFWHYLNTH